VTCWKFPGSFRETAWLGCGPGSAGADYRPDLLTLLTPPELCKAAVVCRCLGAPARNTSGQSSIQELSWKLPGSLPEASRKGLAEAAEGRRPDRRRDRESAQETGGVAAGWAYLARSLTAASKATAPSGLEFETRDGSHSGAVATGRQGLDGAGTGWLCSLLQDFCGGLLLLALAQGSIPAPIPLPARPLAHRLAVTQPARDRIWTRPRVGRKCPLQATYSSH